MDLMIYVSFYNIACWNITLNKTLAYVDIAFNETSPRSRDLLIYSPTDARVLELQYSRRFTDSDRRGRHEADDGSPLRSSEAGNARSLRFKRSGQL